jgi:voltage-gated potassium channel
MKVSLQGLSDRMIDRIVREPLLGAWRAVAVVTIAVTVVGGLLMRVTDPSSFGSVWTGMWWSVQTVTTVGYGDVVPHSAAGRVIAVITMLGGIGFITVTTAAIASAFVEAARGRRGRPSADTESGPDMEDIRRQLEALTAAVHALARDRGSGEPAPGGPG